MVRRYNESVVESDLAEKKVLVTVPRQIRKTTLAESTIWRRGYLSRDIPEQPELILRREFPMAESMGVRSTSS